MYRLIFQGLGVFYGIVVGYTSPYYKIRYSDNDEEELSESEMLLQIKNLYESVPREDDAPLPTVRPESRTAVHSTLPDSSIPIEFSLANGFGIPTPLPQPESDILSGLQTLNIDTAMPLVTVTDKAPCPSNSTYLFLNIRRSIAF